jgi:hypothetical protein
MFRGFSDFYKGRVAVSWTIMTKSKLEPIVLIFEEFYLPCDLGHLVISDGLDESQEICGTDDKWPAITGQSTDLKLSIQTSRSTMEWKMKLGFRKDVLGACGKLVKNYPRSIDPCLEKEKPKPKGKKNLWGKVNLPRLISNNFYKRKYHQRNFQSQKTKRHRLKLRKKKTNQKQQVNRPRKVQLKSRILTDTSPSMNSELMSFKNFKTISTCVTYAINHETSFNEI